MLWVTYTTSPSLKHTSDLTLGHTQALEEPSQSQLCPRGGWLLPLRGSLAVVWLSPCLRPVMPLWRPEVLTDPGPSLSWWQPKLNPSQIRSASPPEFFLLACGNGYGHHPICRWEAWGIFNSEHHGVISLLLPDTWFTLRHHVSQFLQNVAGICLFLSVPSDVWLGPGFGINLLFSSSFFSLQSTQFTCSR